MMFRIAALLLALMAGNAHAIEWNGLFIAGDDSIAAFDNSQQRLTEILSDRGLASMARFTASRPVAKRNRDIKLITEARLTALSEQPITADGEGCLVHLTSHGGEDAGFYLTLDGGTYLDPDYLTALLDATCGANQPTVVLISACFSGQFITDAMKGPNRIILTAARADRPSFGCSATDLYTYWDGCLIEHLPRAKTWARLYDTVSACIAEKEASIDAQPSLPQAWFGANTRGWRILN